MNFSGRSVAAASRVIEIDEVLVATSASGRSDAHRRREDLALGRLVLGRRLDHEIARAEGGEIPGRLRCGSGLAALSSSVRLPFETRRARLPSIVPRPFSRRVGVAVVQQDFEAGRGADLRDAASHLARADDADPLDLHVHLPTCAPDADADARPPGSTDCANATTAREDLPSQPSRPISGAEGTRGAARCDNARAARPRSRCAPAATGPSPCRFPTCSSGTTWNRSPTSP